MMGEIELLDVVNNARLLLALDTLLTEGSVSGAAAALGIHVSAMSRMLSELRTLFSDRILVKTGQGMVPTPLAEALRSRARSMTVMASEMFLQGRQVEGVAAVSVADPWTDPTGLPPVPLPVTNAGMMDGMPSKFAVARRLNSIGDQSPEQRRLAKYISLTSQGPGQARPLSREEAEDALSVVLDGAADPMQVGGLLMTLQYRGVTATELAGFVAAARKRVMGGRREAIRPDLDWPVYISPRWGDAPWFIYAAKLVAGAGHRVLLHGKSVSGTAGGKLESAAKDAGIPICRSTDEIEQALNRQRIAYAPLTTLLPELQGLLGLYPLFESRTPINALANLLNPFSAEAVLVGANHLSERDLYGDVCSLIDATNVMIVNAMRDVAQVNPRRTTRLALLQGQERQEIVLGGRDMTPRSDHPYLTQREHWRAVWTGAASNELAETIVIETTAVALLTISPQDYDFEMAKARASALWAQRRRLAG
ncbi:glycosyl transferase family protein [Neorhizobium sp. NCHU2750]|uniref:glycosyl transferase family protein n=1 Tax=Neorhizobium sp. NCHU2750 TaxID=1825976 RepID=UPI0013C4D7A3